MKRKRRNDAIFEEYMKIAFEFWVSFGIFRLIGNKRDVVRERIVLKEYFEYEK